MKEGVGQSMRNVGNLSEQSRAFNDVLFVVQFFLKISD